MKKYSGTIALINNARGIYSLDTSIGCSTGMAYNNNGCYGDCYAARSAKIYGYDFSKTILRSFESEKHRRQILRQINNVNSDFIRMGCSGDPSENWEHTTHILRQIDKCNKFIVIITKHWTEIPGFILEYLRRINVIINTSVAAVDNEYLLRYRLRQYLKLKKYCKSILRLVTFDFNMDNEHGHKYAGIQSRLLRNENIINTAFRPSAGNPLITAGIIQTKAMQFMRKSNTLVSINNDNIYLGSCKSCPEMCGVNMKCNSLYTNKPGIIKQLVIDF